MLLSELTGVKAQADKKASDILMMLKTDHGIKMNRGMYGIVLTHPKWDHVVKFFPKDDCYLKFVKFAMQSRSHVSKHYPKFKKPPISMKAFFRSSHAHELADHLEKFYAVKIELLKPVIHEGAAYYDKHNAVATAAHICTSIDFIYDYRDITSADKQTAFLKDTERFGMDLSPYQSFADAVIEVYSTKTSGCVYDLHLGNIMLRGDTLVITDPFASMPEAGIALDKILHDRDIDSLTANELQRTVNTMAMTLTDPLY